MTISQSLDGFNTLNNLSLSFTDSVLDVSDTTLNTHMHNIVEYLEAEDEIGSMACRGEADEEIHVYGVNTEAKMIAMAKMF